LKLLVDADAWQIWGQNETYILYFLPPPLFKNVPAPLYSVVQMPNYFAISRNKNKKSKFLFELL